MKLEQIFKLRRRFTHGNLPPKTRQTLKIAGVGIASILSILAIFYVAKLSEINDKNDNKGDIVFLQHEVQKEVELSLASDPAKSIEDNKSEPEYKMDEPVVKVVKDRKGKAKIYEKPPPRQIPLFPQIDIERVKERRTLFHAANSTEIEATLNKVQRAVDADRKKIENKELRLWEPGAQPLRILLVSTWRSGSTFFGQMLQSHPGVFQHYEPLNYIGLHQVRSGKEAFQAQQVVHRLLDCRYDGLDDYMSYTRRHPVDMIGHNRPVWKACKEGPNRMACVDPGFLSESCKMFPIQLVKTVRLRLNLTQLLLNDQKLRVKVLFLVRDPRGTMSSRYTSVDWCSSSPDCQSPEALCQDLQGDLKVAAAFEKLYPNQFLKVKYEDLSNAPMEEAEKIMSFLGLEFSDSIKNYLKENTNVDMDTPWTVKRKSSDRISLWKKKLPLQEIHEIQDACSDVIKTLKYDLV